MIHLNPCQYQLFHHFHHTALKGFVDIVFTDGSLGGHGGLSGGQALGKSLSGLLSEKSLKILSG